MLDYTECSPEFRNSTCKFGSVNDQQVKLTARTVGVCSLDSRCHLMVQGTATQDRNNGSPNVHNIL